MLRSMLVTATVAACLAGLAPTAAVAQAKPNPYGQATVDLKVCNQSGRNATVAVSYVEIGSGQFMNRGWYDVYNGSCVDLVSTDNSNFYMYAETLNSGDLSWGGGHNLCVQYPGPFTRYETGNGRTCDDYEELRGFMPLHAEETGSYTWTLNP